MRHPLITSHHRNGPLFRRNDIQTEFSRIWFQYKENRFGKHNKYSFNYCCKVRIPDSHKILKLPRIHPEPKISWIYLAIGKGMAAYNPSEKRVYLMLGSDLSLVLNFTRDIWISCLVYCVTDDDRRAFSRTDKRLLSETGSLQFGIDTDMTWVPPLSALFIIGSLFTSSSIGVMLWAVVRYSPYSPMHHAAT